MISIVIPVRNQFEITRESIDNIFMYADQKLPVEIIVVDNASDERFAYRGIKVVRQEKNIGFWPALQLGIAEAYHNIVLCVHSDVLIWEPGFDTRIAGHFDEDPLLALLGFFGGRGVAPNGGRGHPEGNMLARKYGTAQILHGYQLHGYHPAVVFDSLALCFDKQKLLTLSPDEIPPHHWTDRIVSLRVIKAGYHAITCGIGFDHGGGFTSGTSISTFSQDYCHAHGIESIDGNYDLAIYRRGEKQFLNELASFVGENNQLWVRHDFSTYTIAQG